jgi:hypothetical protein
MPIPNRNWLLRTRRSMCSNYQDLCNISQVDRDRLRSGVGQAFDIGQRKRLDKAIKTISKAIDEVNALVELPPGS